MDLYMTNWQYKGFRILRDDNDILYIDLPQGYFTIDIQDLPKHLRYDDKKKVQYPTIIHGRIGRDQE